MKILNLKINNFGKLSNKEIELSNGINIIYGSNESGKSTLLKFIMGMFYGLSKNKNGKFISDSEKYEPWDNSEFSGKMTYTLDNKDKFEVFRDFKKKNPKIFNEELEDISSKFNIDKVAGNKFFLDQAGVSEELFSSTIVTFQEEVKLDEKEQAGLLQKMSNIASTGEDNISFNKIMNKLNKKQTEEIGTMRTKDRPINLVSKRIEEINNEKEALNSFKNKQYEIDTHVEELEKQIKEQEIKEELLKKIEQVQQANELEQEKIKINNDAISKYDEKIKTIENTSAKVELNNKDNKKSNNVVGIILSIIFVIITLALLIFIKNNVISSISGVVTIITIICTLHYNHKTKTKKNKLQNEDMIKKQNEIELLKNLKTKLEEEVNTLVTKIQDDYNKKKENIRNEYVGIIETSQIDELLNKKNIQYELLALQNKISGDKVSLHKLEIDKTEVQNKLENLASLEEEYSLLEEQYEELNKNNDLINLVKEEIEKAYTTMKKDITPKFTENLSQIIKKISNGKYQNVKLDETNGMIVEVENGNYMNALHLSTGTIDQLYLSLRLGTGKEISNEKLPIILDEAFAYWDNTRLENILEFLSKEFENRQIILFTCTDREKEALEKIGVKYNYICM